MATFKEYTNDQYKAWFNKPFSYDYGIKEEDMANWFMAQGGAQRGVIKYYGVSYDNLMSTYIPRLKEALGGFALFLFITVAEGGGAGNWINHYASDTSSTGLGCMNDDIEYIKSIYNAVYPIARSAPEVAAGEYVPDNPGEDQEIYDSLENGTVGKYYMPSTMAGNSWVFATQWSIAHNVYYGNPYDQIIDEIKGFGADPFGDTPAADNPDSGKPADDHPATDTGKLATAQQVMDFFMEQFKKDVYSLKDRERYTNGFINMMKTYNNTYHIAPRADFQKFLNDYINDTTAVPGTPTDTPPNDDNTGSIAGGNSDTMNAIYNWAKEHEGQAFDFDGVYGAQCVDLITTINAQLNLGLNLAGVGAQDIYHNDVPDGWEKVPGDVNNDDNSVQIYNTLPNGAIVFWQNAVNGHVAVKAGDAMWTYSQNWTSTGTGGPIVYVNCEPAMRSGWAGFEGAWIKK